MPLVDVLTNVTQAHTANAQEVSTTFQPCARSWHVAGEVALHIHLSVASSEGGWGVMPRAVTSPLDDHCSRYVFRPGP